MHFFQDCKETGNKDSMEIIHLAPHPLYHELFLVLLIWAILTGIRWNLNIVFICITLMTKCVKHFLKCCATIWDSSLENFLYGYVSHFLNWVNCLLISSFQSPLFILDLSFYQMCNLCSCGVPLFSHYGFLCRVEAF